MSLSHRVVERMLLGIDEVCGQGEPLERRQSHIAMAVRDSLSPETNSL